MAIQAPEASPTTNAPSILAVNGGFAGIALVVVILRIYIRSVVLRSIGSDDWVMVAAMVGRLLSFGKICTDIMDQACAVGVLVCFVYETKSGIGRHIQDISPSEFQTLLHWQFYHSIINMVGVGLVKISIGLFLLRFVQAKLCRRIIIGIIGMLSLWFDREC